MLGLRPTRNDGNTNNVERLIPLDAIQAIGLIVFKDGFLDVSFDMGDVIQDVEHTLFVQDLDYRDRSICGGSVSAA